MRKTVIALAASCVLTLPAMADELIIKAGEIYTVTKDKMNMSLDKLVIGDKARIEFESGVDHWELLSKDTTIGYGVIVDASGLIGASGENGDSYADEAESCRSGKSGGSGQAGEAGNRGIDVFMGMDTRKLGSLDVISDGGQGGAGGAGGNGQNAGKIVNCNPGTGGNGGTGGPGGQGGDGGNVVVSLSSLNPDKDVRALTAGVRVSVKPGKAGKGGAGGEGGEGSEGRYIKAKTLSGDRKWVAGGRRGRNGATGEDGEDGSYGQVFVGGQFTGFQPANNMAGGFDGFSNFRATETASKEEQAAQKEIELLKQQLEMLQKRMDKMDEQ